MYEFLESFLNNVHLARRQKEQITEILCCGSVGSTENKPFGFHDRKSQFIVDNRIPSVQFNSENATFYS